MIRLLNTVLSLALASATPIGASAELSALDPPSGQSIQLAVPAGLMILYRFDPDRIVAIGRDVLMERKTPPEMKGIDVTFPNYTFTVFAKDRSLSSIGGRPYRGHTAKYALDCFGGRVQVKEMRHWSPNRKTVNVSEPQPLTSEWLDVVRKDIVNFKTIMCNYGAGWTKGGPSVDYESLAYFVNSHDRYPPAGPNGEYRGSAAELVLPNGPAMTLVSPGDHRSFVRDTTREPFSSVGRLVASSPRGRIRCTAWLVGNDRTLATAAHCLQPGATYTFSLGHEDEGKPQIAAKVVSAGDFPLERDDSDYSVAVNPFTPPNKMWDDWAILELESPAGTEPLPILSEEVFLDIVSGARRGLLHVAGFPGDVALARRMITSQACDVKPREAAYVGTFIADTKCNVYNGMSGGPLLAEMAGRYVPIAIISGSNGGMVTKVIFSSRFWKEVRRRVARDCLEAVALRLRSSPEACVNR